MMKVNLNLVHLRRIECRFAVMIGMKNHVVHINNFSFRTVMKCHNKKGKEPNELYARISLLFLRLLVRLHILILHKFRYKKPDHRNPRV